MRRISAQVTRIAPDAPTAFRSAVASFLPAHVTKSHNWKLRRDSPLYSARWSLKPALAKGLPTVTLHLTIGTSGGHADAVSCQGRDWLWVV